MQACFFAISGVLPAEEAIAHDQGGDREDATASAGAEVVRRNFAAVDAALAHLHAVAPPATATAARRGRPLVAAAAPDFVKRVTAMMMAGKGDLLPVSAFPVDGTWPVATSQWEKRNIARRDPGLGPAHLHPVQPVRAGLPARGHPRQGLRARRSWPARPPRSCPTTSSPYDLKGHKYTLQVAPEDCTGCALCVAVCPAKDKARPAAQGDRHGAAARRCARRSARTTRSSSDLPELDPRSRCRAST